MIRIHHVTLIVKDLSACRNFYRDHFGMRERTVTGLDYPGAFLTLSDQQELHLAQLPDGEPSFRGHFCLRVRDFDAVFRRMRDLGLIDVAPWGRMRELPDRTLQFYVRDPSGNLVEINSEPEDRSAVGEAFIQDAHYGGEPYRFTRTPPAPDR